jgi:tRNA-dihydrouridine synthase 3
MTENSDPLSTPAGDDTTKKSNGDPYSLKVKSQYILSAPHPSLTQPSIMSTSSNNATTKNDIDDNKSTNANQKQKENRHKKNIKNLNKRSRDDYDGFGKVCKALVSGKVCPFGPDKCKFNHDIKEMLNLRQSDIKEVVDGCPHYNLRGFCPFGLTCRVGSSHLNLATGENLQKEPTTSPSDIDTQNVISREVVDKLRKKKYNFKCKRHFEKDDKDNNNSNMDDDATPKINSTNPSTNNSSQSKVESTPRDMTPIDDLKPRKLIDFSNKVYVAPLTTVGNLPFRRIMKKFGADITCGEMAVAKNLLEGKTGEWTLLKRHPDEDVFGVQIAAAYPDVYTRVSEVIENENFNVDFVDLNLGCPIDVMCDHGCGAKLMTRDKNLKHILQGMSSVLSCPITVKIRTGWDEKNPIAHKLVPKIQSWGIDGLAAIMIHGRSRLQRYSKLADWEYIESVANAQSDDLPRIPIIGNGDIFSYTDYEAVQQRNGINATAMIARGALIKPWLPTEIKEKRHWDISASERLDFLKDFVRFGLEHWGSDQQGVNTTRRFLLEWLSFLYRYVPVSLLEVLPQQMNQRPPNFLCGRSDLETLMMSKNCADWVKISEMLLGPVREDFQFEPKHKANSYSSSN